MTVVILCSARIIQDDKKICATQDRASVERIVRNFYFGLKNLFKNVWRIPYVVISWMALLLSVRVEGQLVLTVYVTQSSLKCERHGEYATWDDLQKSPEFKELIDKSDICHSSKQRHER